MHRTFGAGRALLLHGDRNVRQNVAGAPDVQVDVVVCTTGESHALEALRAPSGAWRQRPGEAPQYMLGFEAHAALAEGAGRYDWYGYMEDDLVLTDPLFLDKLAWFSLHMGPDALLLPWRFEIDHGSGEKLYIDGALSPLAGPWQALAERRRLGGRVLGRTVEFERPNNPHAGCFFLSAAQLRRWIDQPHFLDRDTAFIGPLESAATLSLLKTFQVYKPAPEHAGFLELQHGANRYLGAWLNKPKTPSEITWVEPMQARPGRYRFAESSD